MRLLCNGVALDLLSGAALSFKKSNPLFAFDALTCERTQSFDIPATPHNERVMQLAKLPAFRGEGMRRRFEAELQDGIVVKRGYLYVDAYNNGKYKAIFVTGELLGLKAIKDAGKIAELWNTGDVAVIGRDEYDANFSSQASDYRRFVPIKYRRFKGFAVPSISVDYIIQQIASGIGVTVSVPDEAKNLRILPPGAFGIMEQVTNFENKNNGVMPVTDDDPRDLFNTLSTGIDDILVPTEYPFFTRGQNFYQEYYSKDWNYLLGTLYVRQNVTLKFPETFPANVFLGNVTSGTNIEFLGDYSFDKSDFIIEGETYNNNTGACTTFDEGYTYGKPLAGRSVDVPAGAHIIFLTRKDYCHSMLNEEGYYKNDWAFDQPDFSYLISIKGKDKYVEGIDEAVRIVDNLPGITFIELLKSVGNIYGKVLNYTDETGVTFDDLRVEEWQSINITGQTTSETDISRKFGDYARVNRVVFEDDELLDIDEKMEQQYTIDNDNIEKEKELAKIPFSPAAYIVEDGETRAYVRNGSDTGETFEPQKFMMVVSNGTEGDIYMHRVDMTKNAGLQTLCDASTSVNIKVRMTLAQYERMSAKTAILYRGTRYVWTEATWSKEVATLKLSKIL